MNPIRARVFKHDDQWAAVTDNGRIARLFRNHREAMQFAFHATHFERVAQGV